MLFRPIQIFTFFAFLFSAGLLFGLDLENHPGRVIYEKQCASCHGPRGQGTEEHEDALFGDRSIASLARLIERTMPEDEAELCVGKEAEQVAAYIFHAFYSPKARAAIAPAGPARPILSRLTVDQHRNTIADLVARYTPAVKPGRDEAGWDAEYYRSKGMTKAADKKLERIDPQIAFNFGTNSPASGISAEQFSIVWTGSVMARHTGTYEFRTRTENGVRLYLNRDPKPRDRRMRDDSSAARQTALIDDWVSSGPEIRTTSVRVFLLGGRRYPIRLDYFKYKEAHGSVHLEWKPPHGTWSLLDQSHVRTSDAARTFAVDVAFPADDRSHGYERGIAVSKSWQSAVTKAAVLTAEEVADRLPLLAGTRPGDTDRTEKLRRFCREFVGTAFRRPLDDADANIYVDRAFSATDDPETAVKRCIILALTSPKFLYPELAPPEALKQASRLSLALWDSLPDATLHGAAADDGVIGSIPDQAQRMVGDERSRLKMRGFFEHWLEMDERDLAKDKTLYPAFDETTVADLRLSLEFFLEGVLWGEKPDYRELLTADYLLLNGRLQQVYHRPDAEANSPYARVVEKDSKRSGVLTHPYLLSAFAYHNNTSPIHRGVFLTRNIVGRHLKPPPNAVAFKDSEFDPSLTMREKVTELTRSSACMSCHAVINPLGFSLENYDAVGRWRTVDNKKPVNPSSRYTTLDGEDVTINNARDIARFAVGSAAAQEAFIVQLFVHMTKQAPETYGEGTVTELRRSFVASGFDMRKLMVDIAVLHAVAGGS